MTKAQTITRSDARKRLLGRLDAEKHCACCMQRNSYERFDRMRNYEIEQDLREAFGGEWIVDELCPFNGVYSAYGDLHGLMPK
jgi:hypothetical protein